MIGVIANPADHAIVCEFFELFKTPWVFYRPGGDYSVLLCAGVAEAEGSTARLTVIYGGESLQGDTGNERRVLNFQNSGRALSYRGTRLPVYGKSVTFQGDQQGFLFDVECGRDAAYIEKSDGRTLVRIGYDLFDEVRRLLSDGQPVPNAAIPTLDLHIQILRELITAAGISLMEIPPVPHGYRFIACLTHDIDHPSIRRHMFDRTMWGFLYRAIFRSMLNVARQRVPLRHVFRNWAAVLKLPFVYLGAARDFWADFDRYLTIEEGLSSTFFILPFEGRPGTSPGGGTAPPARSSRYGADSVSATIRKLRAAGCEIGLHGIDAWSDAAKALEELEVIRPLADTFAIGTRMHWLYFDAQSPAILEDAGLDYDATVGYNQTIGYRAGTAQAYKPINAVRLLELPLIVMDTALFYPDYLDLAPWDAREQVGRIVAHASRTGGCVTVNWHDRSIAPERCWDDFYASMIEELTNKGAWFATATQAVEWFRKRRSAVFEPESPVQGTVRVNVATKHTGLPGLRLRTHKLRTGPEDDNTCFHDYLDEAVEETIISSCTPCTC